MFPYSLRREGTFHTLVWTTQTILDYINNVKEFDHSMLLHWIIPCHDSGHANVTAQDNEGYPAKPPMSSTSIRFIILKMCDERQIRYYDKTFETSTRIASKRWYLPTNRSEPTKSAESRMLAIEVQTSNARWTASQFFRNDPPRACRRHLVSGLGLMTEFAPSIDESHQTNECSW